MITKSEIRKINKTKRAKMDLAESVRKSSAAAEVFLSSEIYKSAKQIMLYMPLGNEVDTTAVIKAAFCDGKQLVFPVTDGKTGEIIPHYAAEDTVFKKGAFSIQEPYGTSIADLSQVDVILVPGITFDKKGARVGFGKGYYDRLLKNTIALKIGFCYDFQICEEIEAEGHDIRMDLLISESGLIQCQY